MVVTLPVVAPSVPRPVSPRRPAPPRPPDPPPFDYPERLTAEELLALFLPLRRDYRGLAVATAGFGFRERSRLVRQRLGEYSDALTQALASGVDDATVAVRGVRR